MKKLILSSAIAMAALTASAQIPNAGFENWSTTSGYAEPDNWSTLNSLTSALSIYTAQKGTPGNPGASFLKLTSRSAGLGVVPGIAVTGTINTTTMSVSGGFPYTARPANLTGAWQYMAMSNTDQGVVATYLTKWNIAAAKRDTVAYALNPLVGMEMAWVNFSIPLTYVSNTLTPDTAMVFLSASGLSPADGSFLYIDNLAYSGTVPTTGTGVGSTPGLADNFTVYPNPAKDNLNLSFNSSLPGNYTIELSDLSGKIVTSRNAQIKQGDNKLSLNIKTCAPGIYALRLSNGAQSSIQKVVIQ